jgi:Tol biopolymer transport system component
MDPQTGGLRPGDHRDTTQSAGSNSAPAFSPTGEAVAFVSQRTPNVNLSGDRVLVVKSFSSAEERVFDAPNPAGFELQWAPDGRSLLTTGRDALGVEGILRVDLQTGDTTLLAADVPTCASGCSPKGWFPDGRSIYFLKPVTAGASRGPQLLVRRNLETGADEEIARYDTADDHAYLTVSPDGNWLAAWSRDSAAGVAALTVRPVHGGEPRTLVRVDNDPPTELSSLAWSADSRQVLYARHDGAGSSLWRASIDGSGTTNLGRLTGHVYHIALDSTGRRLAYSTRVQSYSVWVMENFLGWAAPRPASIKNPNKR